MYPERKEDEKRKNSVRIFFKEKMSREWKIRKNTQRSCNTAKVCSFFECLDSLPMWAYYADNHRGLCMEYDLHSLPDEINENIYPILYTEQRPEYTSLITDILTAS